MLACILYLKSIRIANIQNLENIICNNSAPRYVLLQSYLEATHIYK